MNVFHFVIIAYLVLLCGCGYKADPFYSTNSACGDFSQVVHSAHSLQRTPSASHSFASHNHENSLTILEFANSVESDSVNHKADCFGDSCESPRNDEVERILLLAKAKSSKNFE